MFLWIYPKLFIAGKTDNRQYVVSFASCLLYVLRVGQFGVKDNGKKF